MNTRFDLERSVNELFLGKLVDDQLAVVRWIAARCEPCDHVVAAARHHGDHDKELRLCFSGQPHDAVVWNHRGGAAVAERLAWELPKIRAVVEKVGRLLVGGWIEP